MIMVFYVEVIVIGVDVQEMFDVGVVIFFGEFCFDVFVEVSVVYCVFVCLQCDFCLGDVLWVGDFCVVVMQVGLFVGENFIMFGYVVVYFMIEDDQVLLLGVIFVDGSFVFL